MQIAPINNTNFNARFKRTKELNTLLRSSDLNTLDRFNKVLDRASKVNDGKIFKISALINSRLENWGKISFFHFHLLSYPEHNEYNTIMENMRSFEYNHASDKGKLFDNYSDTLKSFVTTLEKEYPQTKFSKTHNELIEKINSKLI